MCVWTNVWWAIRRQWDTKKTWLVPPCPAHLTFDYSYPRWWRLPGTGPPSSIFFGSKGEVPRLLLSLLGFDCFQLKITCMPEWHTLGWPALSPIVWHVPRAAAVLCPFGVLLQPLCPWWGKSRVLNVHCYKNGTSIKPRKKISQQDILRQSYCPKFQSCSEL